MITIIEFFDSFIAWLLQTSLKATIIIALIIIVQTLFRNRMPAKWQHALWLLLIIRLIIPVDMPSSLSIFNLTKDVEYRYIPFDSNPHNNFQIKKASTSAGSLTFPFQSDYPENKADISIVSKSPITLFDIAKLLWLTIFFGLLTYKLFINIALRRRIQSAEPVTDARINRILDTCIRRLDLKIDVQIKTLHNIHSPFWYGLFNPRIIFPTSLLQELNDEEIEHICLHELVHYKQKDLPLSLLTTLLQLLHWFNPVIWFAFFKMRSDRELACDEIVLTRLGQHQKKQYGHTLLSLVERASPHGFLPVAVGLAETHYNMKKRVRMIAHFSHKSMWWTAVALLFISFIAVFALTGSKISATVSGTISFQNGVQPDSVHVGVYRLIPTDWPTIDYVGDPFQYATLKKPDYRFHIKPGMYTIAAWAFGYERAFAEIIVQDEKSHITINFDLAPKSLPGKITDVNVIKVSDQPYDLNPAKSVPMQRLGNVWQLHASKYMNSGEQYKFIISGEKSEDSTPFRNVYTYNPGDNQVKIFKEYATFNHLYSGSDITFDPAFFQISPAKAHITISGFDLYEQFAQVQDSLRMFDIYYHKVRREERKNSLEETRQAYVVLTEKFETLEKRYDPYLAPVFHEFWLGNLQGMHPTMIDLQTFLEKGRPDSTTLNTFLQESKFIEYFHQIVDRLQNITPDMIPVDGHLWEGLHFIRMISGIFPTLRQELNIDEDFEFDYTINFCKKTKNNDAKTELLYHMASHYASDDPVDLDKARYLIDWLYRDLPDNWYIEQGHADNIRNRVTLKAGDPAPDFTVSSLDGISLKLSEMRGRFVFLEFWGSNCGPCRGETPHMIRLSQTVTPDSLVLIGLVNSSEQKARDYIREKAIPYQNAMASKELLTAFGVTSYPQTYLIDPDGHICAKDLRGEQLVKRVREKMRLYATK